MSRYHPLVPAQIDWDRATPRCRHHQDIYFSQDGALDETRHVFLQGNQLPQRWQGHSRFCIAETGFGTGLNFLCSVSEWLRSAAADARLDYLAVEKHPLTRTDLRRAIGYWPSLAKPGAELLEQYPPLVHGLHQRRLMNGRVTLTLLFGDAAEMFADLEGRYVEAWYLDGFAPSKNPDMWTPTLFQHIARLSRPGASFATFSAAGAVRRGLQEAGFEVSTRPGFGRKRDMLSGRLVDAPEMHGRQPWFQYPEATITSKHAVVIGAGLAGCSVAHSLAQCGWRITIIERHAQVAQEASGNLAGVVMPRLTADMSAAGRFYLSAFLHTAHWLNQIKKSAIRHCPGFKAACCNYVMTHNSGACRRWDYRPRYWRSVTQRTPVTAAASRFHAAGCSIPAVAGWIRRPCATGCSKMKTATLQPYCTNQHSI